ALAILEGYAEGTVLLRLERRDSAGYRKSGAELHGLHLATPHEVRARDAGWKTQVVLDSARRSRLTSQNDVLDDQRAQTLGASVNGRRHAGRPSTDDEHIEMLVAAEVNVEPEEPRYLIRRRIRDRHFAAEDNRRSSGIDCATLSQCLGFRAVQGHRCVRQPIAARELSDATHVAIGLLTYEIEAAAAIVELPAA